MDKDKVIEDKLTEFYLDHKCDWVQTGNYVHCDRGGHGFFLPTDKMLVKDKKGYAIVDINMVVVK